MCACGVERGSAPRATGPCDVPPAERRLGCVSTRACLWERASARWRRAACRLPRLALHTPKAIEPTCSSRLFDCHNPIPWHRRSATQTLLPTASSHRAVSAYRHDLRSAPGRRTPAPPMGRVPDRCPAQLQASTAPAACRQTSRFRCAIAASMWCCCAGMPEYAGGLRERVVMWT